MKAFLIDYFKDLKYNWKNALLSILFYVIVVVAFEVILYLMIDRFTEDLLEKIPLIMLAYIVAKESADKIIEPKS